MKTKIETETEFDEAIDALGEIEANIASMSEERKVLKTLIDAYANANKILRHTAQKFRLTMKKDVEKIYKLPGVKVEDVIANLKRDEVGKQYITATYNTEAIRSDKVSDETLESWGLARSEPEKHAAVTKV